MDGEVYYFNFTNGESTWEHPCDELYKRKVQEERKKKRGSTGIVTPKSNSSVGSSAAPTQLNQASLVRKTPSLGIKLGPLSAPKVSGNLASINKTGKAEKIDLQSPTSTPSALKSPNFGTMAPKQTDTGEMNRRSSASTLDPINSKSLVIASSEHEHELLAADLKEKKDSLSALLELNKRLVLEQESKNKELIEKNKDFADKTRDLNEKTRDLSDKMRILAEKQRLLDLDIKTLDAKRAETGGL